MVANVSFKQSSCRTNNLSHCSNVFLLVAITIAMSLSSYCKLYFSSSVLAKGLNDGGRGLNIVIVDPKTKDVLRVGHFDTYAEGIPCR